MPVSLSLIRDELLPGLQEIQMRRMRPLYVPATPHIWVPKLTLPQAVAVGAGAALIKNPIITRRFWQGWRW